MTLLLLLLTGIPLTGQLCIQSRFLNIAYSRPFRRCLMFFFLNLTYSILKNDGYL